MHFSFPFTAVQILWTLTFAAQLVLLVVLMGRDRIARYPWFTTGIALFALRLLVEVLLVGRLPTFILQATFITLADLAAIVSLLVVIEIARRAFAGARRIVWINAAIAMAVVAGVVLAFWGQWPLRQVLTIYSPLALLRLMQFTEQKVDLLADLLAVELGLLVVLFGRQFKAGWRSHTQAIAIGLSTVAISWLAVQGIWLSITNHAHPTTRLEYDRIIALSVKLVNANKIVYIAALIWWIVWLWFDEPGSTAAVVPAAVVQNDAPAAIVDTPADEIPGAETPAEEENES
jgi:hypothetical protein